MIEDRQPRRGFPDNAAEPQDFEDGGVDHAWPTAGHRPPGYDVGSASEAYAYRPSGYPGEEDEAPEPRRGAHADGDQDDADDLQYGPPSDRYSVLSELAYEPEQRDRFTPPSAPVEEPEPAEQYDPDARYRPGYDENEGYGENEGYPPGYAEAARDQPGYRDPRYQPGYVEDEQYGPDDQATSVYPNQPDGIPWGPPPLPAETGQPTDIIDLSSPSMLPATHRGEQRKRALILAVAAAGVLLAGGAGYAVFRPSSPATSPADASPVVDPSTGNPSFPDQESASSAGPEPTSPRPSASSSASVSPSPSRSVRVSSTPRRTATTKPTTGPIHLPTLPTPRPTTKAPAPPTTKPTTRPPSAPSSTSPSPSTPPSTPASADDAR